MFCLALNLLFKYLMSQYRSQVWLPCLLLTSAGTFMKLYSFAFFNMLFKVLGKRQPGVHSQAWQGSSSNLSACPHKTQTSVPVHTKLKPKCLSTQNSNLSACPHKTERSVNQWRRQGGLLSALWWPKGKKIPKEGCVYIWQTHFAVQ